MLGDLDEAAAIEEAIAAAEAQAQEEQESSSAVQVISEDSSPDVLTQEEVDQLSASDCKFEQWVKDLTDNQKDHIIKHHYQTHDQLAAFLSYIEYVKMTENVKGCSKCRFRSCERCTKDRAQNYILRHGKLPQWYQKFKPHLLQ